MLARVWPPRLLLLLALAVVATAQSTSIWPVQRIAGGGNSTALEGDAANLALNGIWGIAWDADEQRLFFSEHASNRVRALYANGTIRHIAGSGAGPLPEAIDNAAPAATAAIYHPLGMAFEPGRPGVRGPGLWLGSETLLRRIDLGNSPPLVYTMSGDDGTAGFGDNAGPGGDTGAGAPTGPVRHNNINGVALAANGTVYIAEWYTLRIRAWSPTTGRTYTVAGTGTPSCGADGAALATDFESATAGVCVDDAQGVAYVVEYTCNRVRVVDLNRGTVTTVAGTSNTGAPVAGVLTTPIACAWAAGDGRNPSMLFISEAGAGGRLLVFYPGNGTLEAVASGFDDLGGIALARESGTLYVADRGAGMVSSITRFQVPWQTGPPANAKRTCLVAFHRAPGAQPPECAALGGDKLAWHACLSRACGAAV